MIKLWSQAHKPGDKSFNEQGVGRDISSHGEALAQPISGLSKSPQIVSLHGLRVKDMKQMKVKNMLY